MSTEKLRDFITSQVNAAFPGIYNIPLADAARFAGFAYQTARNQLQDGSFPIATVKIGKRRYISVAVLVDYLVSQAPQPATPAEAEEPPAKRPVGRPRKNPAFAHKRARAAQLVGGMA
jgi:hypothetical protein